MKVKVYGRETCGICKDMLKKFDVFFGHWNLKDKVPVLYYSMDSVDGLTEALAVGATEPPTILIEDNNGKELVRWSGKAITSQEFKPYFKELLPAGAADKEEK
jgi:hypothetical protein